MRIIVLLLSIALSVFIASCGSSGGGDSSGSTEPASSLWSYYGEDFAGLWSAVGPITAYDLNSDGVNDVVLGIPYADLAVGKVVALSGTTGASLWTVEGAGDNHQLGYGITVADDIDGDGFPEFVEARGYFSANGFSRNGILRCISGRTGVVVWDCYGDKDELQLGHSQIAREADFDNDGVSDFLCYSRNSDTTFVNEGNLTAVSAATGTILWSVTGKRVGDSFGTTYDIVADVDGDGIAEVVVGSPYSDDTLSNVGEIAMISGVDGAELWSIRGSAEEMRLGDNLMAIGDVDGDGIQDIYTSYQSASLSGLSDNGHMSVYSGVNGAQIWSEEGPSNSYFLGDNPMLSADLDGDGQQDILCFNYLADVLLSNTGMMTVRSSATGAEIWTFVGSIANERIGSNLIEVEDIDGDTVNDYVTSYKSIDSLGFFNNGRINVISGKTGLSLYTVSGQSTNDYFGDYLHIVDLDNDGTNELLSRSPGATIGGWTSNGSMTLVELATGAILWQIIGAASNEDFSSNLTVVADISGDGIEDIVCGTVNASTNGFTNNGYLTVVSGDNGQVLWRQDGGADSIYYHGEVLSYFDANGDGVNDMVNSYGYASSLGVSDGGRMTLFSGKDGSVLWETFGLFPFGYFGVGIDEFADIDSDGVSDVLDFSGYASSDAGTWAGRIEIISGATGERAE